MSKQELLNQATTYAVEQRRQFHRIPEVSRKEKKTSEAIQAQLEKLGIPYEVVGDYGVVARVDGAGPGKNLAIRADIDALPIEEETDLPFRSELAGAAHACGHDGHIAILLATGKYLTENRDSFHGTVYLCFQQAEEIGVGHEPIILYLKEAGGVDTILGIHLWADIPVGKISLRSGPVMAGTTSFKIKIKGNGCHGSRPDQGRDPINAGVSLVGDVLRLKDREISPLCSNTLSFGLFHAGTATNIIPDEAALGGTMRFFTKEEQERLISLVDRASTATQALTGCKVEWGVGVGLPPVVNHEACVHSARSSAEKVFGTNNIIEFDRIMASDNFGCYLEEFCGMYALIGIQNPELGACYAHHNPKFDMDERALGLAVRFYAEYVEENMVAIAKAETDKSERRKAPTEDGN